MSTTDVNTRIANDRDAWAYITMIDFSLIRDKLRHANPLWTDDFIDRAICAYRQFLFVTRKARERQIRVTPHLAVDAVWHEHILCTRVYMADCQAIFGDYLHHHPGEVGKPSAQDRQAFHDTNRLLLLYFKAKGDTRVTLSDMPCPCEQCLIKHYQTRAEQA